MKVKLIANNRWGFGDEVNTFIKKNSIRPEDLIDMKVEYVGGRVMALIIYRD
ncbi:hypothetical protein [Loigolactobacillus bifermentans]|uniref:Uncharacterized protein n=1 Tax=Loigolactobacillus bifermentans DSM 20003 TaxID=1423726 RepID=A0A0R1H5V4_9LACO|nr:hypothetical protein [Loigolactobacillus bifermentans]KRK39971.1 hypothetical protein FC07_GL001768 [Loigolactobacillus bifermentans DSM 20003]QGG59667.1 hypothetical protein LB003_03755 [Loigolactobacillus bifermentans]